MMKPKPSEILKQSERLRALPQGDAGQVAVNERLKFIREMLTKRARDSAHLTSIIDRCMETLKWLPVPAEVREIADAIAADRAIPEWKPPPEVEHQDVTIADLIGDLKHGIAAHPTGKYSELARKRLAELEQELAQGVRGEVEPS